MCKENAVSSQPATPQPATKSGPLNADELKNVIGFVEATDVLMKDLQEQYRVRMEGQGMKTDPTCTRKRDLPNWILHTIGFLSDTTAKLARESAEQSDRATTLEQGLTSTKDALAKCEKKASELGAQLQQRGLELHQLDEKHKALATRYQESLKEVSQWLKQRQGDL